MSGGAQAVVAEPARTAGVGEELTQAGEFRSSRIESVRAIAALSVVVGHIWVIHLAFRHEFDGYSHRLLTGGGMGVHLFFVLSGYLLFWPFARAQFADRAPVDVRSYAINRALRILPLYYAALIILFALQPLDASRGDWWRFALFIQDYAPRSALKLDSPMWSLAVEVQFYVLLPLIVAGLALVARRSLKRAALVLGAAALASAALRLDTVIVTPNRLPTDFIAGYASFSTLFFLFATGMLLCLLRLQWERRPPRLLQGPLGSAELWLVASVAAWAVVVWDRQWVEGIAVPSFLLIGACVLPLRGTIAYRIMEWRWLARVGVVSYSLYLLHGPLVLALVDKQIVHSPQGIGFVRVEPVSFIKLLVVALPLALAVATVSYLVIERPFLLRRRRWAPAAPRHAADATPAVGPLAADTPS
jgi:peptidoglycan/LPS O-acetylase OafA/YrhL